MGLQKVCHTPGVALTISSLKTDMQNLETNVNNNPPSNATALTDFVQFRGFVNSQILFPTDANGNPLSTWAKSKYYAEQAFGATASDGATQLAAIEKEWLS